MTRTASLVWSVAEIILAGFPLFFAGLVGILGFAAAQGGPHTFPGDMRIRTVCWLIALAMTIIANVWFRRSIRRLRSLRLHDSSSEMGKR
jgi:membrane protein implicated in regulation of membrane protease activity